MAYSIEDARTDAYLLCVVMMTQEEMLAPGSDEYLRHVAAQLYRLYIRNPERMQPSGREPLARI